MSVDFFLSFSVIWIDWMFSVMVLDNALYFMGRG